MSRRTAILAYVPVLHDGYRQFFQKHAEGADLFILGQDLISKFTHLQKEIRQLEPDLVKKAVESWNIFETVAILDENGLKEIAQEKRPILMPKEDVMLQLWEEYLPKHEVLLDSVFLRWEKHNTVTENPVNPDGKVSSDEFDRKMIAVACEEGRKSSDWWRRIGSVAVKDGEIVMATHNIHLPSDHTPYANGDPRNNFYKGVHLELGTSIHSEADVIAQAARKGISLEGAELYVTTFPCPPCAKLVARSGIKKLYYRVGYGVLDGESVLKDHGVEIIQVAE